MPRAHTGAQELLWIGLDPNKSNAKDMPPLHLACASQRERAASLLLHQVEGRSNCTIPQ
jgi:hypothetical protein